MDKKTLLRELRKCTRVYARVCLTEHDMHYLRIVKKDAKQYIDKLDIDKYTASVQDNWLYLG